MMSVLCITHASSDLSHTHAMAQNDLLAVDSP